MRQPFSVFAAATLLAGCTATANADTYRVLSVDDGDTFTATSSSGDKARIRLACIDAPESSQKPAGQAARQSLEQLLPVGSSVTLKVKNTDRYGRTVAEVFDGGRNINLALAGSGMAFVYWDYIAGCDRNRYSVLEASARSQRLGVWGSRLGYDLMLPWDYRACKRAKSCR